MAFAVDAAAYGNCIGPAGPVGCRLVGIGKPAGLVDLVRWPFHRHVGLVRNLMNLFFVGRFLSRYTSGNRAVKGAQVAGCECISRGVSNSAPPEFACEIERRESLDQDHRTAAERAWPNVGILGWCCGRRTNLPM